MGAGGSQFPVSVILNDGGSGFELKEETQDATLFLNKDLLKIRMKPKNIQSLKSGKQEVDEDTICFKYTIDYPKVEQDTFDTRKFSLLYNDTDS